jgi:hypothetical protein
MAKSDNVVAWQYLYYLEIVSFQIIKIETLKTSPCLSIQLTLTIHHEQKHYSFLLTQQEFCFLPSNYLSSWQPGNHCDSNYLH